AAEPTADDLLWLEHNEKFPSVKLRGFGTVVGDFYRRALPRNASGLLVISENVGKAQVLHAKYLSDLSLLPGVSTNTLTVLGQKLAYRIVAQQGVIAAVRHGRMVFIWMAENADDLGALVTQQFTGSRLAFVSEPEVEVPMFLDRWDK